MTWFDIDGARAYLAQGFGKPPSRKVVYNMVKAGLRVARLGTPSVVTRKGRTHTQQRMVFCAEWVDEFLQQRSAAPERSLTRQLADLERETADTRRNE
jgi:hypothetical protein